MCAHQTSKSSPDSPREFPRETFSEAQSLSHVRAKPVVQTGAKCFIIYHFCCFKNFAFDTIVELLSTVCILFGISVGVQRTQCELFASS